MCPAILNQDVYKRQIDGCVELWHTRAEKDLDLTEYLGLTKEEYQIFLAQGNPVSYTHLDVYKRQVLPNDPIHPINRRGRKNFCKEERKFKENPKINI